jgi:signal peptidase I
VNQDETPQMTSAAETAEAAEQPAAHEEWVEIGKTIIYALLIALVLRVLLFQPFTIPSASMEPTLLAGDYIIVSKYSYGYSRHSIPFSPPLFHGRIFDRVPNRGDIIVFKLPRDTKTDYIKRVIGLPGDRVQVKHGIIYINDKPVPQQPVGQVTMTSPYGMTGTVDKFQETFSNGKVHVGYSMDPNADIENTPVFLVPEKNYFMMGDNRDNSLDSRVAEEVGVGFVPEENLVGKAQIILLSWNDKAAIFKPWTWFLDIRPSRFFRILK